jgi:hypothetical protein
MNELAATSYIGLLYWHRRHDIATLIDSQHGKFHASLASKINVGFLQHTQTVQPAT